MSRLLLFFTLSFFTTSLLAIPKLTVVLVVDQFSYIYLQKLEPFLKGGFKTLKENGINYTNAYFAHAQPGTFPGHVGISTGTLPKDHGIVGNYWYNPTTGKKITGLEEKSADKIMVDGFSDQFMMCNNFTHKEAIAISIKDRASIAMASKLGKAIWFDNKTGKFVSSEKYYAKLPQWLEAFNKNKFEVENLSWNLAYPQKKEAYQFKDALNDTYSEYKVVLDNDTLTLSDKNSTSTTPYEKFVLSPSSNDELLKLAELTINENLKRKDDSLLLWVSISAIDLLGHMVGPESIAILDMIYHLDLRLGKFLDFVNQKCGTGESLVLLTADHGVTPIVELLAKRGLNAQRINQKEWIQEINSTIETKLGVKNIITNFKTPTLYVNQKELGSLDAQKRTQLITELKKKITQYTWIKNIWTTDELLKSKLEKNSIEQYFKNQIYPGRSGQIVIQTLPYVYITNYHTGTGHDSPYNYDTHVPITIYGSGLKPQNVCKTVSPLQIPSTLAHLLNTPRPSASLYKILPGIA